MSFKKSDELKIQSPKKVAVGFPAIASVGFRIWEETYVGRGVKTMFKLNQVKGYDCPSCAWPDPDPSERSSIAEYCENGAKAVAWEASKETIGAEFFSRYTINKLLSKSNYWLEKQGRLSTPMYLPQGATNYEPVSWEKAFTIAAEQLNKLQDPNEAIFYTSGRASNEAAFCYQLFVRQFGTNNLPDCSNMCHEATGVALTETTGIGKASVKLDDIAQTDLLLIFGQNPGTNAPRMLTELQKLKQNGGKIIAVNPMPETGFMGFKHPQKPWEWVGDGTPLQDLYLQVKINGDLALVKAILMLLHQAQKLDSSVFDTDFIEKHAVGYHEFIDQLDQENFDDLVVQSGVSAVEIEKAAEYVMNAKKIIIAWAMGITQHTNGEDTIREFVNLLLLKGSIAKPGAGTLPVRGHSNVQGDRTMGIWEKAPESFLANLEKAFAFKAPREHGVTAVEAIEALVAKKAKVFIGLGGNFVHAAPDTDVVEKAMNDADFTLHIATKLNRSHVVHGKSALILPCLGRTEIDETSKGKQFITTEDTAGRVRMSMGDLTPVAPNLKSEVAIVCGLAAATLGNKSSVEWNHFSIDYSLVRNKISEVIPGFDHFNEKVKRAGGFFLPNPARDGRFIGNTEKAKFSVTVPANKQIAKGRFILMTMRSHDQFNTTVYGFDDRYRGISGDREVVLMNKEDIKNNGFESEEKVNITSYFDGKERYLNGFKIVPYPITKGCLAVYFPEGNVLIALENKANESQCPASKFVEVSIKKQTSIL
ncbi:FdhF/YdeP family oxidoreductase [Aquimarina agarilytica]|uniref:FdhF/YdeP family oxidoreductase n=1 Tax=Aquimarina agarilytica TaxID=1087449 RepID=UPI0002885C2A|nr:FdhF/YdeP family oxidoreductase [Aquimarina agarilytica]